MRSAAKRKTKEKATTQRTAKRQSTLAHDSASPDQDARSRDQEARLDEALNETFPASDPVSITQPSRQRRAATKPNRRG